MSVPSGVYLIAFLEQVGEDLSYLFRIGRDHRKVGFEVDFESLVGGARRELANQSDAKLGDIQLVILKHVLLRFDA